MDARFYNGKPFDEGLAKYDYYARRMLIPFIEANGIPFLKNPTTEDKGIDMLVKFDHQCGLELEILRYWNGQKPKETYPFKDYFHSGYEWHCLWKKAQSHTLGNNYLLQLSNPELYYYSEPLPKGECLTDEQLLNRDMLKTICVCTAYFDGMDYSLDNLYRVKNKYRQLIYVNKFTHKDGCTNFDIVPLCGLVQTIRNHQTILEANGHVELIEIIRDCEEYDHFKKEIAIEEALANGTITDFDLFLEAEAYQRWLNSLGNH